MPRSPEAWGDLDLAGSPLLVLGWRPRPKQLEARVVDVQANAHGVLRDLARSAVDDLGTRDSVPWGPDTHLESGEEYLALDTSGLLVGTQTSTDLAEASELLRLVLEPSSLEDLSVDDLDGLPFAFYALVFEQAHNGTPAAFIRAWDPTQLLRRASRWFRFSDSLALAEPPDFALDNRIDLVATSDEVAVLSTVAFERLFADVRTALDDVPAAAQNLAASFLQLPMATETASAVARFCSTRPSLAKRLRRLGGADHVRALDEASFRGVLVEHDVDPALFLDMGQLTFGETQVREFLDIMEGRWFTADFTAERRRADRFRQR